ncbi:MAG: DEAD/DEAH box helicase [archaeon]|nr:DEAD/DEAH box helicase [archaeon]MCP8314484.1 DEAD/DEAH box helicase [archaeon]
MLKSDEAYLEFLEKYDEGLIERNVDIEKIMEKEGIIRSKDQIIKMVENYGIKYEDLPKVMKDILSSRYDYVVYYKLFDENIPEIGCSPYEIGMDSSLAEAIEKSGITKLYKFQEEAIKRILNGENLVIVAPTGSGKTEAFAIPIIHLIGKKIEHFGSLRTGERFVRALFIYPTKALARDQIPKLSRLASSVGARIEIFDGDTPSSERQRIISNPPDIIITNFDTLHYHMMHRTKFSGLLHNIEHIVVDEVHVYTGTFGSNVHFIIKRLKRICNDFQIVAASATISNPSEFCKSLFGIDFSLIMEEEGKRGKMHFAIIFPSLRTHRSLVIDVLKSLASHDYRTLVFSSSHLGAELTAFYAKRNGINVSVHRAGLLPSYRKKIEKEFKLGLLKAVSSTPTLELGIDIGSVDSVISDLVTITRMIHRIGRAGRRGQESITILALRENDPISQYYKNNPKDYFDDIDQGYVDPSNPVIAELQILATSMDKPIRKGEFINFNETLIELKSKKILFEKGDKLIPDYSITRRILEKHDIRGCGETVSITLNGKKIGERSMPQALSELHPEAVYFLAGSRYKSMSFKFEKGAGEAKVKLLPINYPYYTRPLMEDRPAIIKILDKKLIMNIEIAYCELLIEKKVIGYVNFEIGSEGVKGQKAFLEEPIEYKFKTKGIVFRAPIPNKKLSKASIERIEDIACSSYHAAEHVTIEGTNMITGGAAQDMGGIALGSSGLIFIYDGSVGGNGATRLLYDKMDSAFKRALKILEECPCKSESGCPRCTYSYRCGNNNEYLNKLGALEIFQRILSGEPTEIGLPIEGERTFV